MLAEHVAAAPAAQPHPSGAARPPENPGSDAVTGLPNRAVLDWYLKHLCRAAEPAAFESALLLIELTEARNMRYAFGDDICNRFLRTLALRFRGEVQSGQFVASLGGDQIAFVVSRNNGPEGCVALAERLLSRLGQPVRIDGRDYFTSAHIGIFHANLGSQKPGEIIQVAQAALHRAREKGPGAMHFASDDCIRHACEELQLRNEAHAACERGEFHLAYQPIYDLRSNRIRGVEALLRWTSPQFGAISPERFIPMLEQNGAMREVGEWVLRQACCQARLWNRTAHSPVRVSINVSASQLEAEDFELRLIGILAETQCRAEWIELEITESTAVRAVTRMKDRLASIAARGVSLAIDDFGTGYSSFGHLASLPVHHLKLDRALLANLPTDRKGAAIVRAIHALATTLGLVLTVEGVERREQQLFCEQAGLQQGQGYLLARPGPAAEIDRLLALGEEPATCAVRAA